ncbi:hypothetical protein GWK47_010275 [Chionoecetes opilio]|uniref:Uncharacterized protein n=1 Tax=Chionoecetes opilio TaxID=41210 RepID=A0A8J4XX83_CHIOP|nr:hypothetical protein GWK47_010275 [Chionoecetes opilio]
MVPMPRNYQPRNILTTDRTNLEKAFNHRIETGCSIRTACNLFGVKVSTLGDAFTRSLKESDGRTFVPKHQNIKKVFTDAQEHFIEEYSIKISRMFYGLSTRAFRRMVLKYAEAVGSPAISDVWRRVGMATRDWYYGYMFRHPRLALKAPEGMSLARAMAFNRVNVEVFFKAYVEAVERHSFMPARIFNLDESGLSTVMKPSKLQPLDVSVFGPFKSVLRSIQDDFKLSNTHVPITEHMLPEMACKGLGQDSNSNSFISSNSRRHSRSCAALPEGSSTPCCQGRKKIRACILTEDEEALDQLR